MYESQLAQLTQQTFNMESAALATENLRNTMATVDAMKQANKELKKQYGKIDIDKIEVRFVLFRLVPFGPPACDEGKMMRQRCSRCACGTERTLRHGGSAGAGERDPGDAWEVIRGSGRD